MNTRITLTQVLLEEAEATYTITVELNTADLRGS